MNQPAAGAKIKDYELVELLGRSSMGEVWRAVDGEGRDVALKTVVYAAPNYPMLRERFLREAANHQGLQHPAIVPIREFFEHEGGLYLAMQYIPGGSLERWLERLNGDPLPIRDAVSISQRILAALDYAHQHLVIHRDVKPSNILICNGQAYLADFGISVPIGGPRLTSAQQVVGTRCYMSPEQILRPLAVTHLTDVFGFGCVLYEMLTGRQPFAGEGDQEGTSDYAVQTRQINAVALPPRQFNPGVPEPLERVVLTALAKQPQDRFPGCGSFARAIEEALREPEPIQAQASCRDWRTPSPNEGNLTPRESAASTPDKEPPFVNALQPKPQRVSLVLNLGAVMLSGAMVLVMAVASKDETVIGSVGILAGLTTAFFICRLLFKAWSAIQDGHARTTPGKAVGFLFIPIFSFVWCWKAFVGFAMDYNAYLARHGMFSKRCSPALYGVLAMSHFVLPALLWAIGNKALLGLWFLADFFVIAPLICICLGRAINGLSRVTPQRARAAAASGLEAR